MDRWIRVSPWWLLQLFCGQHILIFYTSIAYKGRNSDIFGKEVLLPFIYLPIDTEWSFFIHDTIIAAGGEH